MNKILKAQVFNKIIMTNPKFNQDKSFLVDQFVTYIRIMRYWLNAQHGVLFILKHQQIKRQRELNALSDINNGVPEHLNILLALLI